MLSVKKVKEALKKVVDPELGFNVVELGLIYDIKIKNGKVGVKMTLTAPFCPMASMLLFQAKNAIASLKEVKDVDINLTFNPPWTPEMAKGKAKKTLKQFMNS